MAEKTYVGRGKSIGEYGNIKISICLEECEGYANQSQKNGKHYLNLIVANLKNEDQWGNTKTVYVDDYVPKAGQPVDKATREEFKQYDRPKSNPKPEPEDEEIPIIEDDEDEIDVKDIPF
jgi:hypothetical protein